MADDLVQQTLAFIDQAEQAARDAGGGTWETGCTCEGECRGKPECERIEGDDITIYPEGGHDAAQAEHIARNDPAAVLRRCAADRRIVEAYRLTAEAPELHADAWIVMKDVLADLAEGYRITGEGEDRG